MDPRVAQRLQLIFGELRACEIALNNIQGRAAEAKRELDGLLMGPVSEASNGTITWKEFKTRARMLKPGLQVVTQDAETVANRWKDYLMLSDQDVPDRGTKRKYKVPLENLDPGIRPLNPPPMQFPGR
jgi:hypothetical protein